jgi:hypothetical protein
MGTPLELDRNARYIGKSIVAISEPARFTQDYAIPFFP